MSAAAAAGGGGGAPPPLSNGEVFQKVQEIQEGILDCQDTYESPFKLRDLNNLHSRIMWVSQILIANPDEQCQQYGHELQQLGERVHVRYILDRERDTFNSNIKKILTLCKAVENLKMSQNLKNLLKQLLEVETETIPKGKGGPLDPVIWAHQRRRAREIIREIRKEYEGDILLLPSMEQLRDCGAVQVELLYYCSKSTLEKMIKKYLEGKTFFLTPVQIKKGIIQICSERGVDFKTILPIIGGEPIIYTFFERLVSFLPDFLPTPKFYIDLDTIEEVLASGTVFPVPNRYQWSLSLDKELLQLSYSESGDQCDGPSLESLLPGLGDCLVDYGVNVDKVLEILLIGGKDELARLKAVVDRNDPSELAREKVQRRGHFYDSFYIAFLQRAKKRIYENAKENVEAFSLDEALEITGVVKDPSKIIKGYCDPKARLIGLECKRLRALEREKEKKEAASRASGGVGAARESGGGAGAASAGSANAGEGSSGGGASAGGASAGPAMDKKPG